MLLSKTASDVYINVAENSWKIRLGLQWKEKK